MVQRGSSSRLAAKAFESLRVSRQLVGQKLQCDEAPQLRVFSFIDDAHTPAAQLFDDAVARYRLTDHIGADGLVGSFKS